MSTAASTLPVGWSDILDEMHLRLDHALESANERLGPLPHFDTKAIVSERHQEIANWCERLHRLTTGPDPAAIVILDEADVIVTALGYRPRALPVLDTAGRPIPLLASGPGARPLVDDQCRVLDSAGAPIEGLLGIGLAAGFLSREATGGEPSFSGQTNGLWQWQNDVGCLIAERMRHSRVRSQAVYAERAR